MRVAVTLEQLWHRVPGGTATAILGMVGALDARDDLDVVGVSAWHPSAPRDAFRAPVRIRPLPLPRLALYESWHRLRRPDVQRATGRVDVIHATTSAIPPRSRPLVVTIHDLAFLDRPDHFTARGLRLFHRGLELTRAEADIVLVPSEATRADCISAGVDRERVRVVPWGVAPRSLTDEEIESTVRRFGLEPPFILWTGTLEPRKNVARLLEAFAQLDGRATLALAGPEGWGSVVVSDDTRVRRLGFVAPRDLSALYAAADVFVYPSLKEGFGLPVLEAMAHGAAVVTSRRTSMEEITSDAAVLVDPMDTGSIAEGMRSVLEDDVLRTRLGEAARARAGVFTWARTAESVAEAYRDAAKMSA